MARKQYGVAPANTIDTATKSYVDAAVTPLVTSTATAAGTTTLTNTSSQVQVFTGVTTQTVVLATTSVPASKQWLIMNQSTGIVTVNASGGATVILLGPGTSVTVTAAQATPTLATHWDYQYGGVAVASGKVLQVANSMSIASVDGSIFNFGGTPTVVVTPTSVTTTQTVVASYLIPANMLSAGQAFQFEVFGTQVTAAGTLGLTYYLCLGPNNSSADTALCSLALGCPTLMGANFEGMLTFRTVGSSGTVLGSAVLVTGATASTTAQAISAIASTTTIDTTQALYLTVQCKTSLGTHTAQQGFISVCQV